MGKNKKKNKNVIELPKKYIIDGYEVSIKKNIKDLDKLTGKYFKKSTDRLKKIIKSKRYKNTSKIIRVRKEDDCIKTFIRMFLDVNEIDHEKYFDESDNVILPKEEFSDLSYLKFNRTTSIDSSKYFRRKYLTFVLLNAVKEFKSCEKNIKKKKNETKNDTKARAISSFKAYMISNCESVLNGAGAYKVLTVPYSNTLQVKSKKETRRRVYANIIRHGFQRNKKNSPYDFTKDGYEGIGIWFIFNLALEIITGKKLKYDMPPRHFGSITRKDNLEDELRMLGKQIRKNKKSIQKPFIWYLMCYPHILSNYGNIAGKDNDLYMGILALAFTKFYIGSKDACIEIDRLMNYEARGASMKVRKRESKYIETVVKKNRKKINKTLKEIIKVLE